MRTYKQQFDRLTEAYISGKVNPMLCEACFVGNLLQAKDNRWADSRQIFGEVTNNETWYHSGSKAILLLSDNQYTIKNIVDLEKTFFVGILGTDFKSLSVAQTMILKGELRCREYEDRLFKGFEMALELLKQIHIEQGEVIDETPVFVKRELHSI